MALPYVKIQFENGALGATSPSPDGLLGIVATANTVTDQFELSTPYLLSSYEGLDKLGITADNNPTMEKIVREFYAEAGAGTRVYIMGVPASVSLPEMLNCNNALGARLLIEVSQGAVRGIVAGIATNASYQPNPAKGLDPTVYTAITQGQALGEWAATQKYSPVFVVIEGRHYQGTPTTIDNLTTRVDSRVMVLIGDTAPDTGGAAIGLLAGRIAKIPVQRNAGRVKDGPIKAETIYVGNQPADLADVESLNEKGYVSFRTFVGRAGYFVTDDNMATLPSDDYKYLTYRRTIDKAYRVAYNTLVNEVLDEIPLAADGTIMPAYASSLQGLVERAINTQMTQLGELSADPSDPNDIGVRCLVDPAQNVAANSRVAIKLSVRPYGYSRYVDVFLGFGIGQ